MNPPTVQDIIQAYRENPDQFTPTQKTQIQEIAQRIGAPVEQPAATTGGVIANAIYGAADSLLFGLLPESGLEQTTKAEQTARSIGNTVGTLLPFTFVGKLGIASKLVSKVGARYGTAAALAEGKSAAAAGAGKAGFLSKLIEKNAGAGIIGKVQKFAATQPEYATKIAEGAIAGAWSNLLEDPLQAALGGVIGGGFAMASGKGMVETPPIDPKLMKLSRGNEAALPLLGILQKEAPAMAETEMARINALAKWSNQGLLPGETLGEAVAAPENVKAARRLGFLTKQRGSKRPATPSVTQEITPPVVEEAPPPATSAKHKISDFAEVVDGHVMLKPAYHGLSKEQKMMVFEGLKTMFPNASPLSLKMLRRTLGL